MGYLTCVASIELNGELPECAGEMKGGPSAFQRNANDVQDLLSSSLPSLHLPSIVGIPQFTT